MSPSTEETNMFLDEWITITTWAGIVVTGKVSQETLNTVSVVQDTLAATNIPIDTIQSVSRLDEDDSQECQIILSMNMAGQKIDKLADNVTRVLDEIIDELPEDYENLLEMLQSKVLAKRDAKRDA